MNNNPGSAPAPGAAAAVWLLGLTQVVGYGTLYYSFGILAGDIAADLGWPVSRVFGAFSLTLLAAGFAAPLAGRLVDRHGAATVMTAGSVAAAAGLIAGDVVVRVNTTDILTADDLEKEFRDNPSGVQMVVVRGGERVPISLMPA